MNEWVFDIEANNLLDTVDKIWVVKFKRVGGDEWWDWESEYWESSWGNKKLNLADVMPDIDVAIGHNILGYDLPVIEKVLGIPFGLNTWNGKKVQFIDTLVMSEFWNPDLDGHSLADWGERLGFPKMDYRQHLINLGAMTGNEPKGFEFSFYHPSMHDYCERDVEVTEKLYLHLKEKLK